ncbi:MAG: hypothetical protein ACLGIR_14280 [Actinomycetes bacterium]
MDEPDPSPTDPTLPDPTATESGRQRAARLGLAALLGGAAVAHVVRPGWFEAMVPDVLPGSASFWNLASAAAEGASALLLSRRSTARAGGVLAAVTLVGVFPANVQAVVDGGYGAAPGWLSTRAAAIARLPLQVPLVWWAVSVARRRR